MRYRLLAFVTLLLSLWLCAEAQELNGVVTPDETPILPQLTEENVTVKGNERRSTAWTLAFPLGQHVESSVDTLLYNYQRIALPSMYSDAMATTGNLGGEAMNMIYFERPQGESPFFFDRALSIWLPTLGGQKFYNVYTPMTLLAYNFGGNRDNHTDRLSAQFAGNVNRRIGVAAFIDYLYSKGCYANQSTKDILYGGNVYYNGHRYDMQVLFHAFNFLNKENGGIADDLYITDPGVLQGGDDHVEARSIPVNLQNAHTRMTGSQFYTTQAYKVGFWKTEEVNDTLIRDVYVPVTKFIYSLDYQTRRHRFIDTSAQDNNFFQNTYLSLTGSQDNTYYWHLSNSLGIELMEGFQKWAKFGLSAYATYQVRRYTQVNANDDYQGADPDGNLLTPIPSGINIQPKTTQSLLWVGGRLEKTQGSILKYAADAKFGIIGEAAGEIDVNGRIETNFKLMGDTVSIQAHGSFSNLTPSWLLKQYISNHFVWQNNFGKIRKLKVGGSLLIPWTNTTLSADFESAQNLIYFNAQSMPQQHGGTVGIFAARLHQELHFGIWNWNNTVTYQASTNQDVLPLPALSIYSNMYLGFKAFRVLTLQIGLDCDYFTKYRGLMYQPATASFHVQEKDNTIWVGNYPLINAYVTAKLYKVRFFILWSHIFQGVISKNYFSLPHYPIDPRRLQFGLSIDFAN